MSAVWSRRTRVILVPAVLLVLGSLAASCGGSSNSAGPLRLACVSAPSEVAAGKGGSVYIEDAQGISHYAPSGKLLFRVQAVKDSSFASDRRGDLYYSTSTAIRELSPAGSILHTFREPGYQPEGVDGRTGIIYAVKGGASSGGDTPTTVRRLTPDGRLVSQWATEYSLQLAVAADGSLFGHGGPDAGADVARIDPETGKILAVLHRPLGFTFDALTGTPGGSLFIGVTTNGDAPFAVQRLTPRRSGYALRTINRAQELIQDLAVGSNGKIYVIRASYAEPGAAGGTGLEVLSADGSSQGKVAFCK